MKLYDDNNIFAKILRGEIPSEPVYNNEYVMAFADIDPKAPVHILIIPKGRYTSVHDFGLNASMEESQAMHSAIAGIAENFNMAEDGYRLIANTGDHGGQEVPHFHYHLIGGEKLGAMIGN